MSELPLISVIIPAFNEAEAITSTIDRVASHLGSIEDRFRWELIIVDDGSTDDTRTRAVAAATGEPRIRILSQPSNFNLGQSLRYGFRVARGDYYVVLDADLSYAPETIDALVEVLDSTPAKVVIASPYMDGGSVEGVPAARLAASRTANRILSRAAKGHLTTVTGMVRGYDARFLRTLDLKAMDAEINAEIIYKAQLMRARISEVPATLTWTRADDAARPFRPSRSVAGFLFAAFLFRPYAFFLIPGLLLTLLALFAWIGVIVAGSDDVVPAVFASTVTVIGSLLLGLGVLSAQGKRYFEELWHQGTVRADEPSRTP